MNETGGLVLDYTYIGELTVNGRLPATAWDELQLLFSGATLMSSGNLVLIKSPTDESLISDKKSKFELRAIITASTPLKKGFTKKCHQKLKRASIL